MNLSTPGFPVHHQLSEFTQTHVHWVGDAIQPSHLCRPLLLLPPIPSSMRVFSNQSALCNRWPKYCSFSFNISPSNEHPGLISFRMDWLDLLAVQGTLKSLFQHHSSKASILLCSSFYSPTLTTTHDYWKNRNINYMDHVDKLMSLLFNMLSSLVITFLPRSKHLLISWLQSPYAGILEPPKIKSTSFHCFPIYLPWSDGTGYHDLSFLNVSFKPTFSLSSFTFIKRLFSSSSLSAIRVVPVYLRLDISPSNFDSSLCFIQFSVSHDVLCM